MKNVVEIDGSKALIAFDSDTNKFRGEFVDFNGGADFSPADIKLLKREGKTSLKVFLDMCAEDGAKPRKSYSAKLMMRLPVVLHERAAVSTASQGKGLNAWLAYMVSPAARSRNFSRRYCRCDSATRLITI